MTSSSSLVPLFSLSLFQLGFIMAKPCSLRLCTSLVQSPKEINSCLTILPKIQQELDGRDAPSRDSILKSVVLDYIPTI